MVEGWQDDDYLVLFSDAESAALAGKYRLPNYLPGCTLVGLNGWDEFIVLDPGGSMLALPTVPADLSHASHFALPEQLSLEPDGRFTGKIKWYVKPLVFGGHPEDDANLAWVTHEQHAELVVWWNEQYKAAKASSGPAQ